MFEITVKWVADLIVQSHHGLSFSLHISHCNRNLQNASWALHLHVIALLIVPLRYHRVHVLPLQDL